MYLQSYSPEMSCLSTCPARDNLARFYKRNDVMRVEDFERNVIYAKPYLPYTRQNTFAVF